MAISPDLPGLHVTIEVAGKALHEYEYDIADTSHTYATSKTAKYIEAPSDAEFTIHTLYTAPFDPPLPVHVEIMIDGNYVQAKVLEPGCEDGCDGYKYSKATFTKDEEAETRKFRFSDIMRSQ
jgi:hypothetical protein